MMNRSNFGGFSIKLRSAAACEAADVKTMAEETFTNGVCKVSMPRGWGIMTFIYNFRLISGAQNPARLEHLSNYKTPDEYHYY